MPVLGNSAKWGRGESSGHSTLSCCLAGGGLCPCLAPGFHKAHSLTHTLSVPGTRVTAHFCNSVRPLHLAPFLTAQVGPAGQAGVKGQRIEFSLFRTFPLGSPVKCLCCFSEWKTIRREKEKVSLFQKKIFFFAFLKPCMGRPCISQDLNAIWTLSVHDVNYGSHVTHKSAHGKNGMLGSHNLSEMPHSINQSHSKSW